MTRLQIIPDQDLGDLDGVEGRALVEVVASRPK